MTCFKVSFNLQISFWFFSVCLRNWTNSIVFYSKNFTNHIPVVSGMEMLFFCQLNRAIVQKLKLTVIFQLFTKHLLFLDFLYFTQYFCVSVFSLVYHMPYNLVAVQSYILIKEVKRIFVFSVQVKVILHCSLLMGNSIV